MARRFDIAFLSEAAMDNSFLQEQIERCLKLATGADQFTRKRLLDLAARYETRLNKPSAASRVVRPSVFNSGHQRT
jgi:hypothetical protein